MEQKIKNLKSKFESELENIKDLSELENVRVAYLGKKGSVTDLLKAMKDLSVEDKKTFGQRVNELKGTVAQRIAEKTAEMKEKEVQKEIELMPEFDLSLPTNLSRGSYHPITIVQRQCE